MVMVIERGLPKVIIKRLSPRILVTLLFDKYLAKSYLTPMIAGYLVQKVILFADIL